MIIIIIITMAHERFASAPQRRALRIKIFDHYYNNYYISQDFHLSKE